MKIRPRITLLGLTALACSDRQFDLDPPVVDELCIIAGSSGHWLDGTQTRIRDEQGHHPHVCRCITEDEFWDEARIAELELEMRDELLVECERLATMQGFDWNDCQADYVSGDWFASMTAATLFECGGEGWVGPSDPHDGPPIDCELGELGCSCTVEGVCDAGGTCIDGMCQAAP